MRDAGPAPGTRHERLLQEAAARLNAHGISQTSLGSIAERIGVSRAALYYYIEDQQDLAFQCLRHACDTTARRLDAAVASTPDTLSAVAAFVDRMVDNDEPEIAVFTDVGYLDDEQQRRIMQRYRRLIGDLAGLIENGIRAGEVRSVRSTVVAQAILALVSWAPLTRKWPLTMSVSRKRIARSITMICTRGIAKDRTRDFAYEPLALATPSIPVMSVFDNDAMAAAKRRAITTTACWLFNRKGVNATSLEEIALRLGVTNKVIYHNVGSKQELVAECYRRTAEVAFGVAQRAARYPGTRLQAICAYEHALTEATLREDIAMLRTLVGTSVLPRNVQIECETAARRLMAMGAKLYRAGQAENSVARFDVRALQSILHATREWLPMWWGDATAEEKSQIASEVTEFSRLGLAPL